MNNDRPEYAAVSAADIASGVQQLPFVRAERADLAEPIRSALLSGVRSVAVYSIRKSRRSRRSSTGRLDWRHRLLDTRDLDGNRRVALNGPCADHLPTGRRHPRAENHVPQQ